MAYVLSAIIDSLTSSLGSFVLGILLLYALINFKVLPFAWHIRILYGYFRHYYFDKREIHIATGESLTLFQPTIYTTTTSLGEIDHSLHKSNSTYLTDLDVARGHHFYCLFRVGINKYSKKGSLVPILAGVTCNFKKEIRPFDKVEIWTRVLSWDSKWIYLISHFVRADKNRPSRYTDQPWRNKNRQGVSEPSRQHHTADTVAAANPAIYATCISKYVVKHKRKTVIPSDFFQACGLLAPETIPTAEVSGTDSKGPSQARTDSGFTSSNDSLRRRIDEQRQRGLVLANHVAALDDGVDFFTGSGEVVFAKYGS